MRIRNGESSLMDTLFREGRQVKKRTFHLLAVAARVLPFRMPGHRKKTTYGHGRWRNVAKKLVAAVLDIRPGRLSSQAALAPWSGCGESL
jgi:hypothetical protein